MATPGGLQEAMPIPCSTNFGSAASTQLVPWRAIFRRRQTVTSLLRAYARLRATACPYCSKEIETMKTIKVIFLVSMFAVLSGCMVVPVSPAPPAYYAPAYVAPSIGIGIYGGAWGHGGGHGGGYGGGYGRGWGRR
jgi:hypothetical protein